MRYNILISKKGSVFLELAIVLPVIVALAFATFEVYKMIHYRMVLQSIAKQMAYSAKRDCLARSPSPSDTGSTNLDSCLENTVNSVYQAALLMIPPDFGTKGQLRIYFWRDSDGVPTTGNADPTPTGNLFGPYSFTSTGASSNKPVPTLTIQMENAAKITGGLACAEASYNYVGAFGIASRFIQSIMTGIMLYEVAYF